MPIPGSSTSIATWDARRCTRTTISARGNLIAFATRFTSTCPTCCPFVVTISMSRLRYRQPQLELFFFR
jgi:hypothetical protein